MSNTATSRLSAFELEILHKIESANHEYPAFVVWVSRRGETEFGPVRWSYAANAIDPENRYSVSPFPGAWTTIDESQIIKVRASGALINPDTARRVLADRTF